MEQQYLKAAKRLPPRPSRADIPAEELPEYDHMVARTDQGFTMASKVEMIDGQPYGKPHFDAMTVSPVLAAHVSRMGRAIMARQGAPGTFSGADHEMIDLLLALDSGYYALLAGHTPNAIAYGVRIDAIEAIRDGREDEVLNADEKQQVEFIRAVRDGTMTDDIWERMETRLGTTRGVVEFVYFVLLLQLHHKFCWAVGNPEMSREAFAQMLNEFRAGTREVPAPR